MHACFESKISHVIVDFLCHKSCNNYRSITMVDSKNVKTITFKNCFIIIIFSTKMYPTKLPCIHKFICVNVIVTGDRSS